MTHSTKITDFYHGQDTPQSLQEIILFLADISNRHIHGLRDNDIWQNGTLIENKTEQRLQKIKTGYGLLNCHCRYIAQTTNILFQDVGISSRLVELLSGKCQEKDSRHVVNEISWQNEYFHADVDIGILFTQHLTYLSTLQLQQKINHNQLTKNNLWRLTNTKQVDPTTHKYLIPLLQKDELTIEHYKPLSKSIMIDFDYCIANDQEQDKETILNEIVDSKRPYANFLPTSQFQQKHYTQNGVA